MAGSRSVFTSFHVSILFMADLTLKRLRSRLAVRPDPYWQRLAKGSYIGFRRGPDTWLARFRGRDKKQHFQPLGEGLEYDQAKERAEDWFAQMSGSAVRSVKRGSVIAAVQTYLTDLRRQGRPEAAKKADGQLKTAFGYDRKQDHYADPLASLQLEVATKDDFLEWRDRLAPGRMPRTVNRLVRALVAALNKAHSLGHTGSPTAWQIGNLFDDGEDDTAIFLSPEQRRFLIRQASPEGADFLRALELSGARPHELAKATAGDFDGAHLKLSHKKGRPPRLRTRHVVLDQDGVDFFTSRSRSKSPSDLLFAASGDRPWRRDLWADEVRAAISAHNKASRDSQIPTDASAYSFRHARISELLQVYGVDPLTVAAQTGTSLRMIERTYFKFIPSAMLDKLASLKGSDPKTANPPQDPRQPPTDVL